MNEQREDKPKGIRVGTGELGNKITPETVPQELIDLLDERAGKEHSRTGPVVSTLCEILTLWEKMRPNYIWINGRLSRGRIKFNNDG